MCSGKVAACSDNTLFIGTPKVSTGKRAGGVIIHPSKLFFDQFFNRAPFRAVSINRGTQEINRVQKGLLPLWSLLIL
jgi:hypothetical protein